MQVEIIGCGLVSSLGANLEDAWAAILRGENGIRPIERFPADDFPQKSGGLLPDAVEERLREEHDEDDLALSMILAAAEEAMDGDVDGETGLVLATNFGLMETREWCWRERIDTGEIDAETFDKQQEAATHVARKLGLSGPAVQLSLSCASGGAALALAWQWIIAGRCKRVLAVAYDALTEYCWCGLSNLRTITTDTVRPFNKERHGTIFSEGAAAVLISADERDHAKAQGRVLGAATNNNAYHMTAPAKEAEGSRMVMAEAIRAAGILPQWVDFVSAHGTGTVANDVTESAAIKKLFGDRKPVTALKSMLGHMMGGAGLAEIVLSLKALREGQIPPVANMQEKDPECDVDVVLDSPRVDEYKVAITNSAGLGGNNSSVVLAVGDVPANLGLKADDEVYCSGVSWVLPGETGAGSALPTVSAAELVARNGELSGFPVKEYIHTVKGYLDPNSAYSLAAASLCIGDRPIVSPEQTAVVTATQYGAATSGYKFFEQMCSKGHRFASPMIFPHSYSNTAGNLVAIEFGLAGPHYVFELATDGSEAMWIARDLLRRGQATEALVIFNEGAADVALPDGRMPLHGAICVRLTTDESMAVGKIPEFSSQPGNRAGTVLAALCP